MCNGLNPLNYFYTKRYSDGSFTSDDTAWWPNKRILTISAFAYDGGQVVITTTGHPDVAETDVVVNSGNSVCLNIGGAAISSLFIAVSGAGGEWVIEAYEPV